jgi:succinate dehydrogenase / fumarate reductase iron-sulfur subunit
MARTLELRIFRGDANGGAEQTFKVDAFPGMVVLDAIHVIQQEQDGSLACRWNCKAAKCGSCSAEINGRPRLLCKARVDDFADGEVIHVAPLKTFPIVKDLVTDVSWNYEVSKTIDPLTLSESDSRQPLRMQQIDVDRMQEFRKCIECFLCQDVCHVLRDHRLHDEFIGPRSLVYVASLDMHPLDTEDRLQDLKELHGIGYCNITKCCTKVCPENITITDNAIIPLKERVVDRYYDPLAKLWRFIRSPKAEAPARRENAD